MVKGAATLIKALQDVAAKFPDRVASAIYIESQIIMTESKRRCPVSADGGILRASGRVSEPVRQGRNISCTLSYGGAADAYAIAVHETPSEHDPPSWKEMYSHGGEISWTTPGTGPKFLEGPINEAQGDLLQRIADRIHLDKQGEGDTE